MKSCLKRYSTQEKINKTKKKFNTKEKKKKTTKQQTNKFNTKKTWIILKTANGVLASFYWAHLRCWVVGKMRRLTSHTNLDASGILHTDQERNSLEQLSFLLSITGEPVAGEFLAEQESRCRSAWVWHPNSYHGVILLVALGSKSKEVRWRTVRFRTIPWLREFRSGAERRREWSGECGWVKKAVNHGRNQTQ